MSRTLDEQLAALRGGAAFLRPLARVVRVGGPEAGRWLNDLATAGVAGLGPGRSVRSLVLSPTGRIRADVDIVRTQDAFLLVQAANQPEDVEAVLAPYVLSSAVELGVADARPVLVAAGDRWHARLEPPGGAIEVDPASFDAWRIERGVAIFPVDLDAESLPAEAALDVPPVTDTAKGCFLGQESVARVRNLGHPTRVVLALRSAADVVPGERVRTADGIDVGVVTSAARTDESASIALARVRWDARDAALATERGDALERR
jgi:folate-binding protein YgfZ